MHRQVRDMLEAGIIVKSTSEWSSPVVMQRKANRSYRFCIDFRKLKAVMKASAYPLPHMDTILRKLQDARYISTIDLSSAYHQIALRKEAQALTAFTVPGMGLLEFTRMPYVVVARTVGPCYWPGDGTSCVLLFGRYYYRHGDV